MYALKHRIIAIMRCAKSHTAGLLYPAEPAAGPHVTSQEAWAVTLPLLCLQACLSVSLSLFTLEWGKAFPAHSKTYHPQQQRPVSPLRAAEPPKGPCVQV